MLTDAQFEELAAQNRQKIFSLCKRMLRNWADAEDCVQEALMSAYRKRHQFEGRSSFSSWLYRIAINTCLMFKRSAKKGREFCQLSEDMLVVKGIPENDMDLFRTLLSGLSEDKRRAVEGKVYGLSIEELAILEGVTKASVKCRLFRARKQMTENMMVLQ